MTPTDLATLIADRAADRPRFVVALAGPPGAGKTTFAAALETALHARNVTAQTMAMDGFHRDNAWLDARGLRDRKGAPETFDAAAFVATVADIARADHAVAVPGFDRAADATVPAATTIETATQVVVVEGNYVLLEDAPWGEARPHYGFTALLAPPMAVLERRLVQRWRDHGLSADAAKARAHGNDIPNAMAVLANSAVTDVVIGD